MQASEIESIVSKLLNLKKEYSNDYINTLDEFKDFRMSQRMFYETILSDTFDQGVFDVMMEHKRKIEAGSDQYSVDVSFGKYMADRYIPESLKK